MPLTMTPLRYPGGKSQLRPLVKKIIENSPQQIDCYVEPFCGGAGIAMDLLLKNKVRSIWINDLDPGIFSFWFAVKNENSRLIQWIEDTEISVDEWDRQRAVINQPFEGDYSFELGAAYFFMSRTNRSGVIKGGMIGGRSQSGKYKIDCRFNKTNLIDLIKRIGLKADDIVVSNDDGATLVGETLGYELNPNSTLIFADPPYVKKADGLYLNSFSHSDHVALRDALYRSTFPLWLVTYDDEPMIRDLYSSNEVNDISVRYSAAERRLETEILMLSPSLERSA